MVSDVPRVPWVRARPCHKDEVRLLTPISSVIMAKVRRAYADIPLCEGQGILELVSPQRATENVQLLERPNAMFGAFMDVDSLHMPKKFGVHPVFAWDPSAGRYPSQSSCSEARTDHVADN